VIIGRWHLHIFPFGWFLIGLFAILLLVLTGWFAFRFSNGPLQSQPGRKIP
jgi:hypothetical protein